MRKVQFRTEETITRVKHGYIEIEDSYTQVYDSIFKAFAIVTTPSAMRLIMFYITDSKDGKIRTSLAEYKRYLRILQDNGSEQLSEQAYYKAIKVLVEKGLLLATATRGDYRLCPKLMWRGTISDRTELIQGKAELLHKSFPRTEEEALKIVEEIDGMEIAQIKSEIKQKDRDGITNITNLGQVTHYLLED